AELRAQYRRFVELVGRRPTLVNSHQHAALFPPVGDVLLRLLRPAAAATFFRRVREPWRGPASAPPAPPQPAAPHPPRPPRRLPLGRVDGRRGGPGGGGRGPLLQPRAGPRAGPVRRADVPPRPPRPAPGGPRRPPRRRAAPPPGRRAAAAGAARVRRGLPP